MDKLIISDLKVSTLIGVHTWEQQCPQNLHLDLAYQTDAKKIAVNDQLAQAIDYDALTHHLFTFMAEKHFQLLETLAEHLAQQILTHFATTWVQITIHKPGALKNAKNVSITIERTKP